MPAFCAALGSFHPKSSSTSFVTVLLTVRVLPFFVTVTFTVEDTLTVSSFGARSYIDQRYRSTQLISAPGHGSAGLAGPNASRAGPGTGSGGLSDASWIGGVSDAGSRTEAASRTGAVSGIAASATATSCAV